MNQKQEKMETTALKTLEVTIPAEYVSSLRKLIQGLGGKIQVRPKKKCGLDEAIEDIKAGRVHSYASVDEMWEELMK